MKSGIDLELFPNLHTFPKQTTEVFITMQTTRNHNMKQTEIKTTKNLIEYLQWPPRGLPSAYHYTNLTSLYQIYHNKTLRLSNMEKMNDKYEKKLFPCNDFFFCLSKALDDEVENFGMWAMYGKLLANEIKPENIGVKIYFPKEVLQSLCEHTENLSIHSIAYTNLVENFENSDKKDRPKNKTFIIDHSKGITIADFERQRLCGFIKDTVWHYENEIRLRLKFTSQHAMKETEDIQISSDLLSKLKVYPSPLYEISYIKEIFKTLHQKEEDVIKVDFCENRYRNSLNMRAPR